jgi:beta-1,4-N-acetylglucosaminyltransferase
MPKNKTIFVTVGTTLFEPLVEAVMTEAALQWMVENQYTHLIVQFGKGSQPVTPKNQLDIELYDFKPSLNEDMHKADLILCHAGAGTLMEALQLPAPPPKRIVAVINTALMDNHQAELAHALALHQLLLVVDRVVTAGLPWDDFEHFQPAPYTAGNEHDVPHLIDHFFGWTKAE